MVKNTQLEDVVLEITLDRQIRYINGKTITGTIKMIKLLFGTVFLFKFPFIC